MPRRLELGGKLTDVPAEVVIYEALVEGKLEAPKHLAGGPYMICTSSEI